MTKVKENSATILFRVALTIRVWWKRIYEFIIITNVTNEELHDKSIRDYLFSFLFF